MSLSKIGFMDLYIDLTGNEYSRMRPFVKDKSAPPLVIVPPKYDEEIAEMREIIKDSAKNDFSMHFKDMRFRVSKNKTADFAEWASIRRIPQTIPKFSELRIPKKVQNRLKFFAKNSGLIVFCGATGQGKSTSAVASIEYYLSNFGDICITIEDPAEYDLQGSDWGKNGYCYQFEVEDENEWANYLKMSLRWHPRYIYLGELRTPDATAQAIRAATSGHLVITTLHAGSIEEAIHAVRQLLAPIAKERTDTLIADSFLTFVHQRLLPSGPDMTILYSQGKGLGDPVKAAIRSGKIEQLGTIVENQNNPRLNK
jgi:twitching motility protein PilT